MNDITKRVESQLNINEDGEGTSGTITMEHAEVANIFENNEDMQTEDW